MDNKIWQKKYKREGESSPEQSFMRVARAVSKGNEHIMNTFYREMGSEKFIPGGRILAYAGAGNRKATLSNCFVMGKIEDSMEGIMKALQESAITMKAGGGIGMNYSTLRPYGSKVNGTSSISSGPVSFMEMWNSMSRTISGVGERKGAMIAVLNADHPDIMQFINAKSNNTFENQVLEKFNISIGITDAFMDAVEKDDDWELVFGEIRRTVKARELWETIVKNAWAKAEPGVLFLDNINRLNNLWYCEKIDTCNPCGEQPLPPYGACTLGSINLVRFIKDPFGKSPKVNVDTLIKTVQAAVRFLDNTIDVNYYPLSEQKTEAEGKRRIGLGVMGLGSALAMLKVRYGSSESMSVIEEIFTTIRNTAYETSIELAKEKGPFPIFDREKYIQGEFIKRLPEDIQNSIREHGIRNSHLLTIAPTGSIAQLAGNVSSGVEPIFALEYTRRNYNEDLLVEDYAWKLYKELECPDGEKPEYFVTAHELSWIEHLKVMAICQEYVDSSISKTINVPKNTTVEDLYEVYKHAWRIGLKGCTIYREGSLDVEILKKKEETPLPQQVHINLSSRPYKLEGRTYKVKPPESRHAYYLTFTHLVNSKKVKPFELFINTKNPFVEEWVKALGRVISAVFRNVDDPTFLVDELKEIMGKSGFWSSQRRKFIPSLIAEFGDVMRDYFEEIGIVDPEVPIEAYDGNGNCNNNTHLAYCQACGQQAAVFEEGCLKCLACGYNKCG